MKDIFKDFRIEFGIFGKLFSFNCEIEIIDEPTDNELKESRLIYTSYKDPATGDTIMVPKLRELT